MITTWLDEFVNWFGALLSELDSIFVFAQVSVLDVIIVTIISSMLISMFVARGSAQ